MGMRPLAWMALFLAVLSLGATPVMAGESPTRGGTLRFAMIDTPPSLDAHVLTATLSTTVSQHFLETLFAFTDQYEPVPHLAKSAEVRDGGKLIAIQLREGVLFHNGKEMTSEDVVASLVRWGKFGARAPNLFRHVEQVVADGKYGVRIHLKNPFAPWATMLAYANGGPTIYPKEVMENATKQPVPPSAYIGTGPYRFVDWKAGHEIILERFDKYVKRTDKSDGYAGERVAHFDKLVFVPVADPGTRLNGIKAGEYDYAEYIPGDLFESLEKDSSVSTMIRKAAGFGELFFNQKEGMMTNQKLRQAMQAATNMEPVLSASVGPRAALGFERRPDAPGHQVVLEGRDRAVQPGQCRQGQGAGQGGGIQGRADPLHGDHLVRGSLQRQRRAGEAAQGCRLQHRHADLRLGHPGVAASPTRALGRVLHHPRVRPGPHSFHVHESDLPGLVGLVRQAAVHGGVHRRV